MPCNETAWHDKRSRRSHDRQAPHAHQRPSYRRSLNSYKPRDEELSHDVDTMSTWRLSTRASRYTRLLALRVQRQRAEWKVSMKVLAFLICAVALAIAPRSSARAQYVQVIYPPGWNMVGAPTRRHDRWGGAPSGV